MILADVNVLVYAHRPDVARHEEFKGWLEGVISAPAAFGTSDLVLSGFIRVVTHPRVFRDPTPLPDAFAFAEAVRSSDSAVHLDPGPRHWEIFRGLCERVHPRGNLVPDAFFAALAIEAGAEWITTDRDFSRFPGLRTRHPLE